MSSTHCGSDCHSDPDECVTFDSRSLCWTGRPPIWLEHSEPDEHADETVASLRRRLGADTEPDLEYTCPPQWVRDPPSLPCPHGRASWQMCPHCLGLNAAPYVPGDWTITRTGPA